MGWTSFIVLGHSYDPDPFYTADTLIGVFHSMAEANAAADAEVGKYDSVRVVQANVGDTLDDTMQNVTYQRNREGR